MERLIFIASILVSANVMSFSDSPFFWDPALQQWRINQNGVVYIVPPSSQVVPHCPNDHVACVDVIRTDQSQEHKKSCDCSKCPTEDLVIIDTDGSADDALAILMILKGLQNKTGKSVAGITCARGSTDAYNALDNVIKTLTAYSRSSEIPVFFGGNQGLVKSKENITSAYGKDAFGDFFFFPDLKLESIRKEHAAIFIANLVRENPGRVIIVGTGPLTNIAIAAHLNANLYNDVKQILYHQGSDTKELGLQETDEAPEVVVPWNNFLDPDAARAVLNHEASEGMGAPKITVFSQESEKLYFPWDWRDKLGGGKETEIIKLLNYAESKKPKGEKWYCGSPLGAACLIDPGIIRDESHATCYVDIDGSMNDKGLHSQHAIRFIKRVDEDRIQKLIERCME